MRQHLNSPYWIVLRGHLVIPPKSTRPSQDTTDTIPGHDKANAPSSPLLPLRIKTATTGMSSLRVGGRVHQENLRDNYPCVSQVLRSDVSLGSSKTLTPSQTSRKLRESQTFAPGLRAHILLIPHRPSKNSPLSTPLSRLLMTSKLAALGDGTERIAVPPFCAS